MAFLSGRMLSGALFSSVAAATGSGPDRMAENPNQSGPEGFGVDAAARACGGFRHVLEWIKKEDLLKLNLWEGDKIFLKLLQENAPFFSLKLVYKGDELTEAVLNGENLKKS